MSFLGGLQMPGIVWQLLYFAEEMECGWLLGYTLKTKQTSFAYSLDAGMKEEGQARVMPRA